MLHCYGENSFTFLLFQKLHESDQLISLLLTNLKPFCSDSKVSKNQKDNLADLIKKKHPPAEVWLFPNFGKGSGFGEPDALVLYGEHTFWFEVETNFNLKSRMSSARKSFVQLLRFYYLNRALAQGIRVRKNVGKNHEVVMGPTITGKGKIKDGVLRLAGHKVLNDLREKLIPAAESNRDHYVLLSDNKMKGISKETEQKTALNSFFEQVTREINSKFIERSNKNASLVPPVEPTINRFWYQYYEADLKNKGALLENNTARYVPISSE
ncbi:hypothetical protein [Gimesia panareensis]|uniref:hypothetical protein n=1 Tax=Gimesia panareensis TaxID=2527978 RepID=UPI00118B720B|nr:hypothetical protein [Gimesia panareensis]QDU53127.1 hypothetical protein Pan110_55110 [Gimesia panareensis]